MHTIGCSDATFFAGQRRSCAVVSTMTTQTQSQRVNFHLAYHRPNVQYAAGACCRFSLLALYAQDKERGHREIMSNLRSLKGETLNREPVWCRASPQMANLGTTFDLCFPWCPQSLISATQKAAACRQQQPDWTSFLRRVRRMIICNCPF